MQQRRLRLGDILDDYCPRERRITNHVVVAMIDDQVKQTRCTTCNADHDYKAAKVPPPRRKRQGAAAEDPAEGLLRPRAASEAAEPLDEASPDAFETSTLPDSAASDASSDADADAASDADSDADSGAASDADADAEPMEAAGPDEEDGPVHRRLIRATLPRPEGQAPERKAPDFTIRQPGGRGGREFDGNKPGQRFGQGRRPMRTQDGSQPPRFGGPRHGPSSPGGPRTGSGPGPGPGPGPGRPPGNRPANPGGPRGNRPPGQGSGRGGGGRKRGR